MIVRGVHVPSAKFDLNNIKRIVDLIPTYAMTLILGNISEVKVTVRT